MYMYKHSLHVSVKRDSDYNMFMLIFIFKKDFRVSKTDTRALNLQPTGN